jgi:hypothetical protein
MLVYRLRNDAPGNYIYNIMVHIVKKDDMDGTCSPHSELRIEQNNLVGKP